MVLISFCLSLPKLKKGRNLSLLAKTLEHFKAHSNFFFFFLIWDGFLFLFFIFFYLWWISNFFNNAESTNRSLRFIVPNNRDISGIIHHWALSFSPTPCGSAGKESACNARDLGLIPGLGRSPGEGNGYPLQYPGLENSMDCIVCGFTKSQTRLRDFHEQTLPLKFLNRLQLP